MDSKRLAQLLVGSLSVVLGVLVLANYEIVPGADLVSTIITFLISFLLVAIGGLFWIGTAVGLSKEF